MRASTGLGRRSVSRVPSRNQVAKNHRKCWRANQAGLSHRPYAILRIRRAPGQPGPRDARIDGRTCVLLTKIDKAFFVERDACGVGSSKF